MELNEPMASLLVKQPFWFPLHASVTRLTKTHIESPGREFQRQYIWELKTYFK